MDTIETTEPTAIVVDFQGPTVKDQLIAAGIGLGTALAVPVLFFGTAALFGSVQSGIANVKAKRAAKKEAKVTETVIV